MEQLDAADYSKSFTCLVADDSAFARKNISKVVSMVGGNVVGEAKNGTEAVDLYFRLNPDLLLLDITMPELDGIGTLRKIMGQKKDAKVIIVSSTGHKEMVWKAVCLGSKHFITKPFNPAYAGMIIRSVISGEEGVKP